MTILILISSIMIAYTVNAETGTKAKSNYSLAFNNAYGTIRVDSNGNYLSSSRIVAIRSLTAKIKNKNTIVIPKDYTMAQSYISPVESGNSNRVYCLNMGNHPYPKNGLNKGSNDWDSLSDAQQEAIQNILALGMEGSLKGSSASNDVFKAKNWSDTSHNKGSIVNHRFYRSTSYGSGIYSDSEIYMATQLLIWEITSKFRSANPSNIGTSSCYLVNAFYDKKTNKNANLKKVYDFISERLATMNEVPSFTVKDEDKSKIKTYKFNVKVNESTGRHTIYPSVYNIKSTNSNVLKHYSGLADNIAIKYKNAVTGDTEYLNVETKISNNTLRMTPSLYKDKKGNYVQKPNYKVVGSSFQYHSEEKDLFKGSYDKNKSVKRKANIITYGPGGDEPTAQDQIGINNTSVQIDPVNAYFNLTVGSSKQVDSNERTFNIQKEMRIKSDSIQEGVETDELSSKEEGYYFYVTLPNSSATSKNAVNIEFASLDGTSLKYNRLKSQNSSEALSLKAKDTSGNYNIYYNSTLKEYYTIVGPTDSEGVTNTVDKFMKKYINSSISSSSMPYGNYYVYELGLRKINANFNDPAQFMNPNNYNISNYIESYNFTYKDHLNAFNTTTNSYNTRIVKTVDSSGVTHNITEQIRATKNDLNNLESIKDYYKRLKRVYRAYSPSSSTVTITNVNLFSAPIRFQKYSEDGIYRKILFKLEKKGANGNWIRCDLNKLIKSNVDSDYTTKYPYVNISNGEVCTYDEDDRYNINESKYGTDKIGITPWLYLTEGDYRVTELGHIDKVNTNNTIETSFKHYIIKPDPIEFSVGEDSNILGRSPYYGIYIENKINVTLRVFKSDSNGKPLNGAVYGLYNKNDNLLSTLTTDTMTINGKSYDGVAEVDGLAYEDTDVGDYYLKEIEAPIGYHLDTEKHQVVFNKDDLSKNNYVNVYKLSDSPTKVAFNKVDEEGKPLSGAVLQLLDKNHNLMRTWTTDGNEYVLEGVLEEGETYYLYEKSAPNVEYEVAKYIEFVVNSENEKQVITMKDNYKRGSVTIHKTDNEGNILTGAEFELYKSDGTKISSTVVQDGLYTVGGNTDIYKVDSNGTFKVDKMRFGDYYFIETKAPKGRTPYAGKIEFSIKDDNTLNLQLTVKDDYSIYPNTGGSGYNIPIILAISSIAISIGLLIFIKKKLKTKETEQ